MFCSSEVVETILTGTVFTVWRLEIHTENGRITHVHFYPQDIGVSFLLSVDLGLRTGLALYGRDGRLIWYRSQNYASVKRLKPAVYDIFKETPEISDLVIEGGGRLAEIWIKEAGRRGIRLRQISAETWRQAFLLYREQLSGKAAKKNAGILAKQVIEWSGAKRPTSLRHDAAEAILAGLWGVIDAGWLKEVPGRIFAVTRHKS